MPTKDWNPGETKKIFNKILVLHNTLQGRKEKLLRWVKKIVFPQKKEVNWKDHNSAVAVVIGKIIPP